MIGLLWKYGLGAALLAGVFALHLVDKNQGINDAVVLVRSEYIAAALAASEVARKREQELAVVNEKVRHELHIQKARSDAAAVVTAGRLRDLQAALGSAGSTDTVASASGGTDDPSATIIGECGRAITALDKYAQDLADQTSGLQNYIRGISK
jgi:hypothetical protein